jgi:hypothetical protein
MRLTRSWERHLVWGVFLLVAMVLLLCCVHVRVCDCVYLCVCVRVFASQDVAILYHSIFKKAYGIT